MTALADIFSRPVAHRGLQDPANGMVENTISAAEAAIAGGYGIECDIQLSADGQAMVFHDHTLDRLTAADGPVRERDAAELSAMSVGGSGDTIPTLVRFLDAIGGRAPLIVEVKSRFDGDLRLTQRLVEVLAGRSDPIVVKSFDPDVIAELRRIAPGIACGIVAQSRYDEREAATLGESRMREMTDLLHWERTRPDFLSWRHLDLPAAAPFLGRLLGRVPLMSWTIRSQADADRVRPYADQIVFESFTPESGAAAGQA